MAVIVSESRVIVFLRDMNSWKSPMAWGISPLTYPSFVVDDASGFKAAVVVVAVVFTVVSFDAVWVSVALLLGALLS